MLQIFIATINAMLVMFVCLLIGFILRRTKLLPENTDISLSKLENYVLLPAVNFLSFMQYCTVDSLIKNRNLIFYSTIATISAVCISSILSKMFKTDSKYRRNIYKYALTFGNYGFLGNAIVPVILSGQEHLYNYLLFTLPLTVILYLWGINLLIPHKEHRHNPIKRILTVPMIFLFIGLLIGISGTHRYVPEFVITTADMLNKCMGPVAMILTGFVIGGYNLKDLFYDKKVFAASILRLFIVPVAIMVLLKLLGADKYIITLTLFAFATPFGLNTIIFPAAYGEETKTGAAMAMISHALCIISIPIIYILI